MAFDTPLTRPTSARREVIQVGKRWYVAEYSGPRGAPEMVAGPFLYADAAHAALRGAANARVNRAIRAARNPDDGE